MKPDAVVFTPKEDTIVLTIDRRMAEILTRICENIAGDPKTTLRSHTDALLNVLHPIVRPGVPSNAMLVTKEYPLDVDVKISGVGMTLTEIEPPF